MVLAHGAWPLPVGETRCTKAQGPCGAALPLRARGGPLRKKQSEKETVHGVPVTRRAQEGCRKRMVCNTGRVMRTGSSPDARHCGAGVRPRSPSSKLSRTPWAHSREFCMPRLSAGTMRQRLTLILVRVINTSISTLAPSNRLPPGYPCEIYPVLAATRFDAADPMPYPGVLPQARNQPRTFL